MNRTGVGAALLAATMALVLAVLGAVARAPRPAAAVAATDPAAHARAMRGREVRQRFEQGVLMLHARRYDEAIAAFHRVLELAPRLPEAQANMGYALLGLERHAAARDFFGAAIDLRPAQANAYYGLAVAQEALCDLPAARGAMRTYLHLARPDDRWVRQARAALWEWEEADTPRPGCPAPPASDPAVPTP